MPILYTKARPSGNRLPVSWWTSSDRGWYDNLGDELTPNTSLIDVVNDFPWTLTPTNSNARKEVPYIYLREFLQLETQLNQCLLPYGKSIGNISGSSLNESSLPGTEAGLELFKQLASAISPDINKLYGGLFDHLTATNFVYKLPFFTPNYFDIKNNWEATDVLDKIIDIQTQIGSSLRTGTEALIGDKGQSISGFLQSLPRLYKQIEIFNLKSRNPTVGLMDPPRVWKDVTNRTYSFEFPLYNISSLTNENSKNVIVKNWEFCYLLTYQNLVNKRNFFTGIPPVFYEVMIPGIHYCKASYISDLTITNLGNIRLQKLILNNVECEVNIPDAYSIKITFTDLLQPSKNLLAAATNTSILNQIQTQTGGT